MNWKAATANAGEVQLLPGEAVNATLSNGPAEKILALEGHPVRMSMFDQRYGDRLKRLNGVLLRVTAQGLLLECLPAARNVAPGTPVTLEVRHGHILTWFHTTVIPPVSPAGHQMALALPTSIQTSQRRLHPRAEVSLPIHALRAGAHLPERLTIVDISAGGIALHADTPVEVGEQLTVAFGLGSGLFFENINAMVLRCTESVRGGYLLGAKFLNITPACHMTLLRWVEATLTPACNAPMEFAPE